MKRLLLFIFIFLVEIISYGQNKTLGVGVATPNPNAALHVESPTSNQGFIMPRLTTVNRTAPGFQGVLTTAEVGLMVYDIDLNAIYIWDGTKWGSVAKLAFPYQDSILSAPANSNLLKLYYGGSSVGNVGVAYFENLNPNNAFAPILSRTLGTGSASNFIINNSANAGSAVNGTTNGTGAAIRGVNSGTGNAANFSITNAASTAQALRAATNGSGAAISGANTGIANGFAGLFNTTQTSNTFPAIQASTAGTGTGVRVIQNATSIGGGMDVVMQNTTGTALGFSVDQQGLGSAGNFNINNASSSARAVNASTNGTGAAIFGSTSTGYSAVAGQHNGTSNGFGGLFEVTNATNTFQAIKATSVGTGGAARFETNNAAGTNPNIESVTNASGGGILSTSTGTGYAGNFNINNVASTATALNATTNGTGSAGYFEINNATSGTPTLYSKTNGTGVVGQFVKNGSGNAAAVLAENLSDGAAGAFIINNVASTQSSIYGTTNGTGVSIQGATTGTGAAGNFGINNGSSTSSSLYVSTNGIGRALHANHTGASGDVAIFQSSDLNVARIDKTGKGFFNGGTQASGADVAEMFDVEGERQNYEPGEVLVISEISNRTVEKSSTTNSTKVVGVYATKPGVVLTEKGIDENFDQLVPMGVIGVIPTKVCLENGVIKRGDLLVTSSKSGHAMKAISIKGDGVFPAGVIIGKALENFESGESGLIKVLVNVK